MRRFRVFLDKRLQGVEPDICIVEMPDDASDEACELACQEALGSMIDNELYTGWTEMPGSGR